ncbi:hypothetical protein JHL22_05110 [Advenella sp. WQ 585]|uniref:Uncharacterized protein n=1 Tax=Advenella mandrilli TaxID=2800330 RepID=A0ABS1EC49_9BURK|nr:hypothetical protein [Advenella mandrilli]MBK1780590.1 hypothetical protein [Advenella mandrilli]
MGKESKDKNNMIDGESVTIRYDGLDSADHQIDLNQLGVSLQGFARILAVCSHFSVTGQYNKQYDALSVKVYAAPVEKHNCYEVMAVIQGVAQSGQFWSGTGGALLTGLIGYIFNRRKEVEMKHLSKALEQSLGQNAENASRLMTVIEKMADGLAASARQALAPIGNSCSDISITEKKEGTTVKFDQKTKNLVMIPKTSTIEPTREYNGYIVEMDIRNGNCKIELAGSTEDQVTVSAVISDPIASLAGNSYAISMANRTAIKFLAKAEIDQDGNISRLHISDLVAPPKASST